MASQLSNVGIVDMDGFTINRVFYCKELGMIKVGDAVGRSVFFDIGICWADLSAKDKTTCRYVMQKIHKLRFGVPRGVESIEITALEGIVWDFYPAVWQDTNSVIGYKGGCCERDLLASIGIPLVNLEWLGSPKAKGLIYCLVWLETCAKHTVSDAYLHCPKVEVEAFEQWLQSKLLRQ